MTAVMKACTDWDGADNSARFNPKENRTLKKAIIAARKAMIPENYIQRVIQFAEQGYNEIEFKTYDTDWDSGGLPYCFGTEFKQLRTREQRIP